MKVKSILTMYSEKHVSDSQKRRIAALLPLRYDLGMSFPDTVVLFVLALLLFGPKKLPQIARQVGKALGEFKRASNEFKAQIESEISQLEFEEKKKEQEQSLPKIEPISGSIPSSRFTSPEKQADSDSSSPDINSPAQSSHA
jgi:sec-independent protein translocase protein TatB